MSKARRQQGCGAWLGWESRAGPLPAPHTASLAGAPLCSLRKGQPCGWDQEGDRAAGTAGPGQGGAMASHRAVVSPRGLRATQPFTSIASSTFPLVCFPEWLEARRSRPHWVLCEGQLLPSLHAARPWARKSHSHSQEMTLLGPQEVVSATGAPPCLVGRSHRHPDPDRVPTGLVCRAAPRPLQANMAPCRPGPGLDAVPAEQALDTEPPAQRT